MTDRDLPHGPELEPDRIRVLLEDAVSDVQPAPGLDRIRSRTKVTPMRQRRPWFLAAAGAVAATAATITVVTFANDRTPQSDDGPGPAATTTATPTEPPSEEPSDGASPSPTPSETPSNAGGVEPPGGTVALPVYLVGDTPTGPRLFREFHETSVEAGWPARLLAALEQSVGGRAQDPDFGSAWSATGAEVVKADVDQAEGRLVLGVDGENLAEPPAAITPDEARIAVQQLVYTAQAVLQQRLPVRFFDADGAPLDTLLGVDVSGQVQAAPALEVQAPVWVTSPQDGEQVGTTFTVQGRGAFFEANVSWQLLGEDGAVVDEDFATAQECCTLSPYSFEVTAPPGDYVLRVFAADVSDGEGPGEQEDTKRITVR